VTVSFVVSNKNSYFTMACCAFCTNSNGIISLIKLPVNSMITQLQKLWIFYYTPTRYSSDLFRSLHYYRPSLIIWLERRMLW